MTSKICSVQYANELCVERRISSKERTVEAVVITVVAHDQGWSDFPHLHGQYNGSCNIEARIVRSDGEVPVFSSQLLALRHADCRDQLYICTLRKSHPSIERLQDGNKICVFARSMYKEWRITVMQGSIWVVYDKSDLGLRSDGFEDLFLKDGVSNTRINFRAERLPPVLQACTLPVSVHFSRASCDGRPANTEQIMRSVVQPTFDKSDPTALKFELVSANATTIFSVHSTLSDR